MGLLRRGVVVVVASLLAAGCGAQPAPRAMPTASVGGGGGGGGSNASNDGARDVERGHGPLVWSTFPGPTQRPTDGSLVWIVAPPAESDWSANLAVFRVKGNADTDSLVVQQGDRPVRVPGLFTRPIAPIPHKEGDAVIVDAGVLPGGGASYGRVVAVLKEAKGERYVVRTVIGNDVKTVITEPDALLPLDDKLAMGAPAAYQNGQSWREVVYIGQGTAEDRAWVLDFANHAEQRPRPKPLLLSKVYAKGDKVWAAQYSTFEAAVVLDVLDRGVRYRLRIAGAWEETLGFDRVTSKL